MRAAGFDSRSLLAALGALVGCSGGAAPSPSPRAPALSSWPVPSEWKHEVIPFPLEFAPSLTHRGLEELRFPPGFLDESSANRWSYAFVWRLEDAATMNADQLRAELETYFRGLLAAVDGDKHRLVPDQITATARSQGDVFELTAHVIDTFRSAGPVDLVGRAWRVSCGSGALWTFVLAPPTSPLRSTLDELAARAACGQTPVR